MQYVRFDKHQEKKLNLGLMSEYSYLNPGDETQRQNPVRVINSASDIKLNSSLGIIRAMHFLHIIQSLFLFQVLYKS